MGIIAVTLAIMLLAGRGILLLTRKVDLPHGYRLAVLTAYAVACLFVLVGQSAWRVDGISMAPTYSSGEVVVGLAQTEYGRGDIITFTREGVSYVKRIIGVGGDTVSFREGKVYVNDTMIAEEYLPDNTYTACAKRFVVPQGEYFVLGDNRQWSRDSRAWSKPYVSRGEVTAKIYAVLNIADLFG